MSVELKVPDVGESITEAQIVEWLKTEGEGVELDDPLAVLETDKATVELPSPVTGTLTEIVKDEGETVAVGEVIGYMEEGDRPARETRKAGKGKESTKKPESKKRSATTAVKEEEEEESADEEKRSRGKTSDTRRERRGRSRPQKRPRPAAVGADSGVAHGARARVLPAARRLLEEHDLSEDDVEATGPGGRLLKEDVLRHLGQLETSEGRSEDGKGEVEEEEAEDDASRTPARDEEIVPMSPMRRRIAERLVEAKQQAALLTTFNEIDMTRVIELRRTYQEAFRKKYDVKLGFMSFFVKAVVEALKEVPQLNAEVRGTDIAYRHYHDIGVAVGGGKGLVVPVLRGAERMSFADIELAIGDFARRARTNDLRLEELQGGTFTISNGGVYGSLLSTPIVNPPQSGILGLHAIEDRPVAHQGEVVIRAMMYVALTYDHRIVDGREAVMFLRHIKEVVEDPSRILIEV